MSIYYLGGELTVKVMAFKTPAASTVCETLVTDATACTVLQHVVSIKTLYNNSKSVKVVVVVVIVLPIILCKYIVPLHNDIISTRRRTV